MPLKMTLNDHEFTLSNEALVAMAATLWHTKVKERGFMLCLGREPVGEITPGTEHIGGSGSITEKNCPGKVRVGSYHTHPLPGTSRPSWMDAYAMLSNSYWHGMPWLGCRGAGAKYEEEIRCDTVKEVPSLATLQALRHRLKKMGHTPAEADPIWNYFARPYSFPARKVPEIIKPPVPIPVAPRVKTEELSFAGSMFKRYTNLDTGETSIERVY